MKIDWKRMGVLAAVVVASALSVPSNATRHPVDIHPCGRCDPTDICGQVNQVPKLCGPTKDGPWTGSTYACCCCVEGGRNNWFWGG